jgi:Skp family chaperone for outer membrane proteins
MKTLRLFAAGFFVAALFAVSAFAQVNPAGTQPAGPAKIAVIDTRFFDDAKTGITKYTNAMNTLENEFKPVNTELQTMVTKYQTLGTEIQNLQKNANPQVPISQSTIQAKIDEYGKLERDIKFKQEDAKARLDSRQATLLGPILQDIGKAMQEYAKQKGYTVILDIAKMADAGLILAMDEKADVTKDFITFYNARPAGAASTATTPK